MKLTSRLLSLLAVASPLVLSAADTPATAANVRTDWIDPDTGHRIVRLSTEPGSQTLYFHDNSYSVKGDKLLITTPSGIALVDVAKIGKGSNPPEVVVQGGRGGYMARRTPELYYSKG